MSDYKYNNIQTKTAGYDLAINNVLKNTYMLLAMTLGFSAVCAYASVLMNVKAINPFIFLIGAFGLQFLIHMTANSSVGILATFLFTGFMGFTAGPLLNFTLSTTNNGAELIMLALGGTALIFFALSGYILSTKKDMTFMGGALVAGSVVALIVMFANIFFQIPALHLAMCCFFILLSAGLIMYQTSLIIHGGETNYILATVSLYVSIYNIFISLLQLLMSFNSDR
jgi:modulator of FtsH protease